MLKHFCTAHGCSALVTQPSVVKSNHRSPPDPAHSFGGSLWLLSILSIHGNLSFKDNNHFLRDIFYTFLLLYQAHCMFLVPVPLPWCLLLLYRVQHGLLHRVEAGNTYHLQKCYDHFLLKFYAIKWHKLWWNVIIQIQQQNEADSKHDLTTECVENTPALSANTRKVVDNLCHSIQSFWSHTLFMEKVIYLCL